MTSSIRFIGFARVLLLSLVLILITGLSLPVAHAHKGVPEAKQTRPVFVRGKTKILEAGTSRARIYVPPSPDVPNRSRPASAIFEVTYEGFPNEAKTAFQYAAHLWGRQLTTTVPIRVHAVWSSFDRSSILGGAEPHMNVANFPNAPHRDTLYPIALANKIAGYDLIPNGPDAHDITVHVNGDREDWSFRTDDSWAGNTYSFVTLALHEIGHGLGFAGSMRVNNDLVVQWGSADGYPEIYDRFAVNQSGQSLIDTAVFPNPSSALYEPLTTAVFWNGPNGIAATQGQRPELWTPSIWNEGSSYSHLTEGGSDEGAYDYRFDRLMTPVLDREEIILDPGPVARGMLRDMGWQADYAPLPGRPVAQIYVYPAYADSSHAAFVNNRVKLFVTNYSATATSLRVLAGDTMVYDGPFSPDENRSMRLEVTVPGGATCEPVTLTAILSNAEGDSEPATQVVQLDGAVQSSLTVTSPTIRLRFPYAEGPRVGGGDPTYAPSDTVLVRAPEEVEGCSRLDSFTLVYDSVPHGPLPADYTQSKIPSRGDLNMEIPLLGREQDPIVPGTYEFHVFLTDQAGNRTRFPSSEETFRITIDQTPPTARYDLDIPSPSEPIQPGLVYVNLAGLRVTDDMYPDQGNGQPYWGYWVIVSPLLPEGPPSEEEWYFSGIVVPGQARSLLWKIPQPTAGEPLPSPGYRMWLRVLDGAGNASDAIVAPLTQVADPHFVNLPLVQR